MKCFFLFELELIKKSSQRRFKFLQAEYDEFDYENILVKNVSVSHKDRNTIIVWFQDDEFIFRAVVVPGYRGPGMSIH